MLLCVSANTYINLLKSQMTLSYGSNCITENIFTNAWLNVLFRCYLAISLCIPYMRDLKVTISQMATRWKWVKEWTYLSSHRGQVWAWHHQWLYHLGDHALESLQWWSEFEIPAQEFPQKVAPTYTLDCLEIATVVGQYALKAGIVCLGYLSQSRTYGRLNAGKTSPWRQSLVRQDEHCPWAFQTRLQCTGIDLQWKW